MVMRDRNAFRLSVLNVLIEDSLAIYSTSYPRKEVNRNVQKCNTGEFRSHVPPYIAEGSPSLYIPMGYRNILAELHNPFYRVVLHENDRGNWISLVFIVKNDEYGPILLTLFWRGVADPMGYSSWVSAVAPVLRKGVISYEYGRPYQIRDTNPYIPEHGSPEFREELHDSLTPFLFDLLWDNPIIFKALS